MPALWTLVIMLQLIDRDLDQVISEPGESGHMITTHIDAKITYDQSLSCHNNSQSMRW